MTTSEFVADQEICDLAQPEQGRVHSRVYTDPAIFDRELKHIFYSTWVFVAHESEVATVGDYKTTYIGRVPVIVTRGDDMALRVLVNRCAHRGATVCQRELGNANFFKCEYHGWVYDNAGELKGITLRSGFQDGEIPAGLGLDRAPRVDVYQGCIFASLAAEGPGLRETLGGAATYLDEWAQRSPNGRLVVAGVTRQRYAGNWKLQVEGSNERYHAEFLHRVDTQMSARLAAQQGTVVTAKRTPVAADERGIDFGNGHSLMEIPPAYGTVQLAKYPAELVAQAVKDLDTSDPTDILGPYWRMVVFPNVAFASTHFRVIRPIDVNLTEVSQYYVDVSDWPESANLIRKREEESFYGAAGFGAPDDLEMFTRIQRGLAANDWPGANPWVLFKREVTTERIDESGTRYAHAASEIEQRAMYHAWRDLMGSKKD
jgi:phenylpropionate dioxygenase-like ring-hydroxylating dioxygenase large terminal subunit